MHIKKTLPLALVFAGFAAPTLAVEQGETYLGGGLSRITIDPDDPDSADIEPTSAIVRIGYGFVDNFAVEGRAGFGLSDDRTQTGDADVDIESIFSGYLVGYLPVANRFSVYGLAGYSVVDTEVTAIASGNSITGDGDGFSYGIGAEADFTDSISGYVEYIEYPDGETESNDSYDVTGATIGAKYSF